MRGEVVDIVVVVGTVLSSATHSKLTHLGVSDGHRLPSAPPQIGSNGRDLDEVVLARVVIGVVIDGAAVEAETVVAVVTVAVSVGVTIAVAVVMVVVVSVAVAEVTAAVVVVMVAVVSPAVAVVMAAVVEVAGVQILHETRQFLTRRASSQGRVSSSWVQFRKSRQSGRGGGPGSGSGPHHSMGIR